LELTGTKEPILGAFQKAQNPPINVKRIDDHLFIKFDKTETNFWTPQLHLEINDVDDKNCKVYGLFGPNPTLWTFFMFLHFGVATLFIALGIWAYVNASLGKPYILQTALMILLILIWIALYIFGRLGKRKGRPQMEMLHTFMMNTIINN